MNIPASITSIRAYKYAGNDHWSLPVGIDGVRVWSIVDTGSNTSVVSHDMAAALSLMRIESEDIYSAPTAGGLNASGCEYRMRHMTIGPYVFPWKRICGLDMQHIFQGPYQALLGLDVLKRIGAFLDICGRRIYITKLPNKTERGAPLRGAPHL